LIVNADDFGASRGINRGIIEAHQKGILTSASLMVNAPWSREATDLMQAARQLSVGLHADLGAMRQSQNDNWRQEARAELRAQFNRFRELAGQSPSHLDSHHNVHRAPQLLPIFLELAREFDLPLRENLPVRYYPNFYGQWGGQTHLEQISPENLERILQNEIGIGVTELSCHPGYIDPDFQSGYSTEREAELRTLCHPRARQILKEQAIELVSYHDLARLQNHLLLCPAQESTP
jgi:predicted glycoside hydrolase/deacetylase ChbG (UPF0249 family)